MSPRLLLAAALVAAAIGFAPPVNAAPGNPSATPSGAPVDKTVSVTTSAGAAKPGTSIRVSGSGWPARITIQASTCGNNAIKGAADCVGQGAGSTVTDGQGNFSVDLTVGKPPKPCPCVIHVVSPDTTISVDQPFEVIGQPTGPLDQSVTIRTLTATSKLTGAGPLSAWIGGKASRTYVLTVKNTGNVALTNPGVTLTVGKGADPTTLLSAPGIGTVQPGQTLVYRVPITIKAPAFGQYRVRAYFSDVDTPLSTTASTSTYPWALIVVIWLLLQPVLLGLYRRRPLAEPEPEDPFAPSLPRLNDPFPSAGAVSAEDPLYALSAPLLVGAAVASGIAPAQSQIPVPVGAAMVPRIPRPLVPGYQPVFGVTDLRYYLEPNGTTPPPVVAPRIVMGGIVPTGIPAAPNGNGAYPT